MRNIFTLLVLLGLSTSLIAQDGKNQDTTNTSFGKGLINVVAKDSTWYAKVSFRFQTQFEGTYVDLEDNSEQNSYTDRFRVRRARIKGSGWATKNRKLGYKFEYDVHNGFVLDAVIKWKFNKSWQLWFGQTKLPGNIERVISSQKLQFVDRSLLNSLFTLDRDAGVQLRGKHSLGEDFVIREKLSFSQGEGLNQTGRSTGHGYTARLELYPFGDFKDVYVSSALKRHQSSKLMISATYDYNQEAARQRGRQGSYLTEGLPLKDLQTIFIDMHYKYGGLSIMAEYAHKTTSDGSPFVHAILDDGVQSIVLQENYYTGESLNAQVGYLLASNWEIAGRYTTVTPEKVISSPTLDQYGLAVSKYIVGHNLKVQSDINLLQTEGSNDQIMFRLQTEFNF